MRSTEAKQPDQHVSSGLTNRRTFMQYLAMLGIGGHALFRSGNLKAAYAEAKETLACSYLSFALLLGLAANSLAGWWWADPVAALLMVPWLVKEGRERLAGEKCS